MCCDIARLDVHTRHYASSHLQDVVELSGNVTQLKNQLAAFNTTVDAMRMSGLKETEQNLPLVSQT